MGGASTKLIHENSHENNVFVVNESIPGQGCRAMLIFQKLGIPEHVINKMFEIFCICDEDGSSMISAPEFLRSFGLPATDFTSHVFAIMDADSNGKIDFTEFVVAVWNYCTYSMAALVHFSFALFDSDSSGHLDFQEVEDLVKVVYGRSFDTRVEKLLKHLDVNGDGIVTLQEFTLLNRRFPLLLYPAFKMQNILRQKVLGEKFWMKEEQRRADTFRSKNIFEILEELQIRIDGTQKDNGFISEEALFR